MSNFRIFTKTLLILPLFFIFSCSSNPLVSRQAFLTDDGAASIKDITQKRDMSQYEQAGNFYSRWRGPGMENGEKKVRDFIWQHWTEKKRGYIKITSIGADTRNTTHYFIEPNEKGEWQVARRQIYRHNDYESGNSPLVFEDIVTTDRVDSKKEIDDWQITFRTKEGEMLDSLPNL